MLNVFYTSQGLPEGHEGKPGFPLVAPFPVNLQVTLGELDHPTLESTLVASLGQCR